MKNAKYEKPPTENARPEAFIKEITENGGVSLGFTEEITFPNNIVELIEKSKVIQEEQ